MRLGPRQTLARHCWRNNGVLQLRLLTLACVLRPVSRMARSGIRSVLLALLALTSPFAVSHELTMAEMELRETSPGEFLYIWSASNEKHPSTDDLVPRWPDGCTAEANIVHCGAQGLRGAFSVDGVGKRYSAALVKVYWRDGQSH